MFRENVSGPFGANTSNYSQRTKERGETRGQRPLKERLATPWEKDEVLHSLDHKIGQYSTRHGGQKRLMAERAAVIQSGERAKELAILDKMKKDEEGGALAL